MKNNRLNTDEEIIALKGIMSSFVVSIFLCVLATQKLKGYVNIS